MTCCRTWLENAPRDEKAYLFQSEMSGTITVAAPFNRFKTKFEWLFFSGCVCVFVRFLLVFLLLIYYTICQRR